MATALNKLAVLLRETTSVGKVPGGGGTFFISASAPAIARIGIAWANCPKNIATPAVTLYQGV